MNAAIFGIAGDMDAHYLSIGRFVVVYSQIEILMRDVLARYAELSNNSAPVLIGSLRMGQMIEAAKQVIENTQQDPRVAKDFREIASALEKLATLRNKYVHRSWAMTEEGMALNNIGTAKTLQKFELQHITSEQIDHSTAELISLLPRLAGHCMKREVWEKIPEAFRPAGSFPWFETAA